MEFTPGSFDHARSVERHERFATPMADILDELERDTDEIMQFAELEAEAAATEASREYVIEGIPTTEEIRQLTELPFEVSITEHEGRLVLSTGTVDNSTHEYKTPIGDIDPVDDRHFDSLVSLHTHPGYKNESTPEPTLPSYADLIASLGQFKPTLIAGPNSLLKIAFAKTVTDRRLLSSLQKDLDLDTDKAWEILSHELSEEELSQLQKELGDEILVHEFQWDDPRLSDELANLLHARH